MLKFIFVTDFIVISGDDEKEGEALGEYHLLRSDANQIIYQQSTTEQPNWTKLKFIYFIEDSGWWVGEKVGTEDGWFFNPSLSKTLPLSGWMYDDGTKYQADNSIQIKEGRLTPSCNEITISLAGDVLQFQGPVAGVYKLQHGRMFNGRHVFKNENDRLLFIANEGAWWIGPKLLWYNLKSKSGAKIPLSSDEWKYYWSGDHNTDEVTVSCKLMNPGE